MKAFVAEGVCRRYGRQEVLKDFTLSVEAGGLEVLMGPSGSGKSTFLHIAAGLLSADSGSILIGGEDIVKMSDSKATKFRRRHVGVVFQAFNLLNEKTVLQNVLLPLALESRASARRPETIARAESLLARLGLEAKAGARPEELSGGEQQRVALARALIAEPEIILADEPTGNLDASSAKVTCEMLRTVTAGEKSAVLMVTHDPVVAAYANKVHFLNNGRAVDSFSPNGDAALISRRYLETYQ